MSSNRIDIDIVIPYVDSSDPKWIEKKKQCDGNGPENDDSPKRYRSWDNLQYVLRGIEKFAPWVHKVYLITDHQVPEWINLDNEKIVCINHEDYIPEEYLPTFNSHTIELNFHRIPDLSEHFIYFNDDTFLINPVSSDFFFKDGLPCDSAMQAPILANDKIFYHIVANDIVFINENYRRNTVLKKYKNKFFSSKDIKATIANLFYKRAISRQKFFGFYTPHQPSAFLKSSFISAWEENPEWFHTTCTHKFRNSDDLNQYAIRYYQYVNGLFTPFNNRIYSHSFQLNDTENENNISRAINAIHSTTIKMLCLNEGIIDDFEKTRDTINHELNSILPDKSSFEK